MTYCKVIACCYNPDRAIRAGKSWPDHNQHVNTLEEHETMWRKMISNEMYWNAGVPMDTIIVCNGPIPFLQQFDGKVTPNGTIKVVTRPNLGGSFGAYTHAVEDFVYDYYLFTEEDIFIQGNHFYKKIVNEWDLLTGFMALIGIGIRPETHAHGGVGVCSRNILVQLYERFGRLPNHAGEWDRSKAVDLGEVPFTHEILRMGYGIKHLGPNDWTDESFARPYQSR